jgi:hypothetical protein
MATILPKPRQYKKDSKTLIISDLDKGTQTQIECSFWEINNVTGDIILKGKITQITDHKTEQIEKLYQLKILLQQAIQIIN